MNALNTLKPIAGYEGLYSASPNGGIYSHISDKWMSQDAITGDGYRMVGLRKDKKQKQCSIHRLVALTFIPNPYDLEEVNHKDGIKTNNDVSNLEWVTHGENQHHARVMGMNRGTSVLTPEMVRNIRAEPKTPGYQTRLAKQLGCSTTVIWQCLSGKTYTYIQ